MYIAEGYKCKQEVSCLHVSRAVGTMCEVVSAHCFSPAVSPPSLMLLMWDSSQWQGNSGTLEITDTTGQANRQRGSWGTTIKDKRGSQIVRQKTLERKDNDGWTERQFERKQAKRNEVNSRGKTQTVCLMWARTVSSSGHLLNSVWVWHSTLLFFSSFPPPGGHHELRGPAGRSGAGDRQRAV